MWNLIRFVLMQRILIYDFYNFLLRTKRYESSKFALKCVKKNKLNKQKETEGVVVLLLSKKYFNP